MSKRVRMPRRLAVVAGTSTAGCFVRAAASRASTGSSAPTIGSGAVHDVSHRRGRARAGSSSTRLSSVAVVQRADDLAAVEHRELRDVVAADQRRARGAPARPPSTVSSVRARRAVLPTARSATRVSVGIEQVVVAHPLVVVHLGQVALAGVGQQHDDERRSGRSLLRHLERRPRAPCRPSRRRGCPPRAPAGAPVLSDVVVVAPRRRRRSREKS